MRIETLRLVGYRSFQSSEIEFSPTLTTIVGENAVGKSSLRSAVNLVLSQTQTDQDIMNIVDYPYSTVGDLEIDLAVSVGTDTIMDGFEASWLNGLQVSLDRRPFRDWVESVSDVLVMNMTRPDSGRPSPTTHPR